MYLEETLLCEKTEEKKDFDKMLAQEKKKVERILQNLAPYKFEEN